MAPVLPSPGPTPDEDLASVSLEDIDSLMRRFEEKVAANNPDFYPEDIERVKRDQLWCRRFIAHAEFKVDSALNMLYETCQWRKEFGTNELDHTKLPAHVLQKGNLFIRNQDKWGKKLLIFKAKFHQKGQEDFEDLKKQIVYYFERIERETKSGQISVIFDMKDTGWSNMDMDFIRYLITLLKQYYPYFVNYLMIFEMPWLLKSAWNIIKGWLPPKFVDRVKFIDKKSVGEFIDPDNQLVDWGGNDSYEYSFEPEIRGRRGNTATDSTAMKSPKISVTNGNHSSGDHDAIVEEKVQVRRRAPPIKARSSPAPPADEEVQTPSPSPKPSDMNKPQQQQAHLEVDSEDEYERSSSPATRSPVPSSPVLVPRQTSAIGPDDVTVNGNDDRSQLARVDIVVKFEKEKATSEINGHFNIENIAQNRESIIFKVKTTDPSKFRVRPTIGVLDGGTKATVHINVMDGVSLHHIARERFQAQTTVLPNEYKTGLLTAGSTDIESGGGGAGTPGNRSSTINYLQLNNLWKQITSLPNAYLETHRMTCRLDPSLTASENADGAGTSGNSKSPTISREDTRRALDQLEQKIATSFNARLNEKFDYLIKLTYGLFVLILLATIFLWMSIPSTKS